MCPAITGGGKQQPNACSPGIGTLEKSCASTSTPEDLAQSYWEKNGDVLVLRGMCFADSVDAMRSILNGSRSSHTSRKASGCSLTIDSRDGREIASATLLAAVGIHFSVKMKPYSTCRSKRFTNNARVAGSLARPRLNAPTTDWLSTLIRTCARRYSSGRRVQNCLYFFVQELVEDDTITIHYVKTQDQLTDIGTKHFSKHLTGSL